MPNTVEAVGSSITIGSLTLCLESLGSFGWEATDKIDTTCLSNTEYETFMPATLKRGSDISFTCKYNENVFEEIETEINLNQSITITITNIGSVVFYGYLAEFIPDEAGVGDAWTASGTIHVTNETTNTETGPTFNS